MIPAITPPTDNLYKFLSLFGLTIFLFSVYMLSDIYQKGTIVDIKLEQVFQRASVENDKAELAHFKKQHISLRPFHRIDGNILEARNLFSRMHLSSERINELNGQLNIIEVEVHAFQQRMLSHWILLSSGVLLIVWGFLRWRIKDQLHRDALLLLELQIKQEDLKKLQLQNKTRSDQQENAVTTH